MDNDLEKDKNGLPEGTSDINEEKKFDNLEKEAIGNEEVVSAECAEEQSENAEEVDKADLKENKEAEVNDTDTA